MGDGFYKTVVDCLKDNGYTRVPGGKGSHEKWINFAKNHTTTVPRNLMSRHTANGILKDCGIPFKI